MAKNVALAAILGLIFGPFGYLYLGRKMDFLVGLIMVVIMLFAFGLSLSLLLWLFFAWHCYIIARNINRKERRDLNSKI
jgi:choline-glycine betaine transporter